MNDMNDTDIKESILSYSSGRGLLCGICGADAVASSGPVVARLGRGGTPFVRHSLNRRVDPALTLGGVRSVVVIGRPYPRYRVTYAGGVRTPRGRISASAVGADYHRALADELNGLVLFLRELGCEFEHRVGVDTGPLCEREFARAAGLGYFGRNCCLYSPAAGSFFNIGLMMTSLELSPTQGFPPDYNECGGCGECARACPGGAIYGGPEFGIDYDRCVSYLTQKSGALSDAEASSIGVSVYGCDICQDVCPKNAHIPYKIIDGKTSEGFAPDLNALAGITKADFEARFSGTSLYWRGAAVIRRNAGIALRNYGKLSHF